MNSELIMKMDVLDILFDKRNKTYGAYTLRKFYGNRLFKSLGCMLAAVILFSAFTMLPDTKLYTATVAVKDVELGKIGPSNKIPLPKPVPKKAIMLKMVPTVKLNTNIVIVNNKESVDVLQDLKDMSIGSVTSLTGDKGEIQIIAPGGGGSELTTAPLTTADQPEDINVPLDNPEIMPMYPGGMEALRKFLMRHLSNPRDLEEGELISVKVKFVVGYDGNLKSFELVQDGGNEFNNEVIRVLKKMPAWIPGKSKGRNVSVYYTIPVKFIPQD